MAQNKERTIDIVSFLSYLEDIGVLSSSQALKLISYSNLYDEALENSSEILKTHFLTLNEKEIAEMSTRIFEKFSNISASRKTSNLNNDSSKRALSSEPAAYSFDHLNTVNIKTIPNGNPEATKKENNMIRDIKKKRFEISKVYRKKEKDEHLGLFDRLYEEKYGFEEAGLLKKEAQRLIDSKQCPFSPEINNISPSEATFKKGENDQSLQTTFYLRMENFIEKKRHAQINKSLKKEEESTMNCTFKPDLTLSSSSAFNKDIKNISQNCPAYERLYQNALTSSTRTLQMKMQKSQKDVADCTFSPFINDSQNPNQAKAKIASDRLFEHSFLRKADYERREQLKQEREVKECTFTPKLTLSAVADGVPTTSSKHSFQDPDRKQGDNVIERLLEWNREKEERLKKNRDLQLNSLKGKKPISNLNQTPIFDRLYKEMFEKKKKLENLQKETFKSILTFAPNINPARTKTKRSASVTDIRPKIIRTGENRLNKSGEEQKLITKAGGKVARSTKGFPRGDFSNSKRAKSSGGDKK